jgi:rod shape-determining protein MreC
MVSGTANRQGVGAPGGALGLRTFVMAGAAIALMFLAQRTDFLEPLRGGLALVVYPVQATVSAPGEFMGWLSETTQSRAALAIENARLKRERLLANARLQRLSAVETENERLRSMLGARPRVGEDVRVAEILQVDSDPFRHIVTVDKGAGDGAFQGQTVVDTDGVVGQIVGVGPVSAEVMLISDPGHAVAVEVNRNGLRAVVFGSGEYDRLDLPYIANNADLKIGDLLVTSSLGSDFPAGYPVAVITEFEVRPRQSFARVSARPAAALNQIREVLLLWPTPEPDPVEAAAAGDEAGDGR